MINKTESCELVSMLSKINELVGAVNTLTNNINYLLLDKMKGMTPTEVWLNKLACIRNVKQSGDYSLFNTKRCFNRYIAEQELACREAGYNEIANNIVAELTDYEYSVALYDLSGDQT